jgi:multidrug resistance efflux pump
MAALFCAIVVSRRAARQLVSGAEQERERTVKQAQEEANRAREKSEAAAKIEWEREKLKFETQTATTRRELERLEVDMVVLGRVVQHGVEVDVVDLGHRRNVARQRAGHLDMVLALEHEHMADLEGLA